MAQSLRIETLDRSGRWYLTPGSRSIYDLRVRNDAKDATDCSIVVEDPASGVTVDPPTFTLRGHEVRTVTVLFSERANPTRAQRVLMKLCDNSGAQLASFEHPLIVTGGTDCSIELAFKDAIMQDGELQGFVLLATVHSQSEAPCAFALTMTPHPALSVPELPPVQLEPGAGADVLIPVRWDQSKKDESGLNHPTLLEIGVPVSNGKRTKRLRWDSFAQRLTAIKKPASGKTQSAPSNRASQSDPRTSTFKSPPATVAEKTLAPLLMLSGQMALKCLPNPAAASTNGAATNGVATIAKAEPSAAEAMELPLFAAPQAQPPAKPSAPAAATAPTQATAPKPQPAVNAAPSASAPPATSSQAPKVAPPSVTPAAPSSWAAVITPAAALSEQAAPPKTTPTPSPPQVQAPTNVAPQATVPTTAPASPAAPSSSQPAAPAAATPPPPPTQGPRLTPYTRARWNIEDNLAAAIVAPPPKAASTPSAPADEAAVAPPARTTATVIRTRAASSTPVKRGAPAGFIIGAAAVAAIAVAAFLFRPNSAPKPAQPVTSSATVAVATQSAKVSTAAALPAAISPRRTAIAVHAKRPAVSVTPGAHATPARATPTPAPTAAPATPRPATPKPAAQKPAAVAVHHQAPAVVRPRPQPVQQLTQAVVALGQVEAFYGPRGHAVRVLWSAADQASASVQLIDDRGTIVSSTSVRGSRQSAILYLPRRFHGGLTVQVSSVGRGGERVATTTSLAAFGN